MGGAVTTRRMYDLAHAAQGLQAAAVRMAPNMLRFGERFREVSRQINRLVDAFAGWAPPRRRPARKPCAWCTDRVKRPATHTVKWHQEIVWSNLYDGGDAADQRVTPAGRRQIMCQFHAGRAVRYPGVKVYRFRRLK